MTAGPFDELTSIVSKKSYSATQSKTDKNLKEQNLADLISGFIKFEYNYFGYIQGSFKLNENPVALEFDHETVVSRGQILTQTPMVICLVLNVGDQCMGNLYKDPSEGKQTSTNLKLRSMTKT